MRKIHVILGFIVLFLATSNIALAQCANLLTEDYISDGQYYTTKINSDEVKNCEITFIKGNEYRLIVCPHKAEKIRMEIVDKEGHLIFDNKNYDYTNYWNFRIMSSVTCTIKLSLVDDVVKTDEKRIAVLQKR